MCLPIEPYKVDKQWIGPGGLLCAVTQNREGGNRCGYVRVGPSHPWHGKGYDDVMVDVHGGLTFAELEPCTEHEDGQGWWFGFDCAHYGDALIDPNPPEPLSQKAQMTREIMTRYPAISHHTEHYWTPAEVEEECNRLAMQLVAAEVAAPVAWRIGLSAHLTISKRPGRKIRKGVV
jgi:hypothetical protein